jgi:hypothetical protein
MMKLAKSKGARSADLIREWVLERLCAAFERLAPQSPINTVQDRRNVADAIIEAGRYLW